jgi:uncharacterized protein (DUF2147 family)
MLRLLICFALLSLHAAAADNPAAAPANSATAFPSEYWVSEKDGWTVKTMPCDSGLCAYLVDFKPQPEDPPGYQPVDEHNPDKSKRGDLLCGHIMMGGFQASKDGDATWDGGWVYDPDHGTTYSGKITVVDQDTVKLRGFIGISLLGRTLVLHRQATAPKQCTDQARQ